MILTAIALPACVSRPKSNAGPASAESRAIEFLSREVPAWSRDNGCFSCHNNGDAARALYAASQRGHRIPKNALADTTAWVVRPERWDHNKGDPGFSDQRLADVQFAASLAAALESGMVKDHQAMQTAARRVAQAQADDGSWPIDAGNVVGSPATYGTALATYMAWRTLNLVTSPETAAARHKAAQRLGTIVPDTVPNAAVFLLFLSKNQEYPSPVLADTPPRNQPTPDPSQEGSKATDARLQFPSWEGSGVGSWKPFGRLDDSWSPSASDGLRGRSERSGLDKIENAAAAAAALRSSLQFLLNAQTSDGGWGPYADSPPEAFDTALALLALVDYEEETGVSEMIRRGREFLVSIQLSDGSWPATTRPSGGRSYAQQMSTTGWATLALLATR